MDSLDQAAITAASNQPPQLVLRTGTVTDVAGATATVRVDGGGTALPAVIGFGVVVVGDRVVMLFDPSGVAVIIGSPGPTTFPSAHSTRASTNIVCNGTAWANLDTGMDLTLPAVAGDVIEVSLNGAWSSEAVNAVLDVSCVTSGTHFAAGGAAEFGVQGWAGLTAVITYFGGTYRRTLVAADINGTEVVLRLRVRTLTAANKTLFAIAANPLQFQATNLR